MKTLLLGCLPVPGKYRQYIEYLKTLQSTGRVYEKSVVDNLVERLIEIANDNLCIKEACARKSIPATPSFVSAALETALDQPIERGVSEMWVDVGRPEHSPKLFSLPEPSAPLLSSPARGEESLQASPDELRAESPEKQLLRIREELSELNAYALSVLLLIGEIEGVLGGLGV
ncbi:hypothetical protein NEDG_01068 [Nematocida displodere]|uniref:Uncharacterized protein n=1 Tax=Nematocida displodere TaxID=1805483 RepID=A0A177ED55_9MICR|nr:hypothetical protein NEDG_01068 [Nematocida displodere]